ncbi:MAG: hypothetical protein KIS77_09855 [Saprospiraceae bacterium]|nr:hypothetical protein [Saprospiraceae bacterium]
MNVRHFIFFLFLLPSAAQAQSGGFMLRVEQRPKCLNQNSQDWRTCKTRHGENFRNSEILKILIQTEKCRNMIKDTLTYKIIGCVMKVRNTLGPGFQEV